MRMLDELSNNAVNNLTLLLELEELEELKNSLTLLIENKENSGYHIHIDNSDYTHEITVALYDKNKSNSQFNERIQKLIDSDA